MRNSKGAGGGGRGRDCGKGKADEQGEGGVDLAENVLLLVAFEVCGRAGAGARKGASVYLGCCVCGRGDGWQAGGERR